MPVVEWGVPTTNSTLMDGRGDPKILMKLLPKWISPPLVKGGGTPPKFDPYGPEGEPENRHKTGPQGTPWAYTYSIYRTRHAESIGDDPEARGPLFI